MNISDIQKSISLEGADAWILVDYENRNQTLVSLLGHKMLTRKIFLVVPSVGRPYLICHLIDTVNLKDEATAACFDLKVYKTWNEMLALQKDLFSAYKTVLMDVSEFGLLPRVSLADEGSVSFVRSLGLEIKSSANLLQRVSAILDESQFLSQVEACRRSLQIKDEAFRFIAEKIRTEGQTSEYEVQQFIAKRYHEEGMVFDEEAIVAIGPNANDPHYAPTKEKNSPIREGDLVLIDMWAKLDQPKAVYSDITWMGYVGTTIPKEYASRFEIVKNARDAVIHFLEEQLPLRTVLAFEADDVARKVITEAGYGEYFIHRGGHNIADDVSCHGPGANLDNYESHDFRELLEATSFSDEPGIYAPDFGVRSETDLHIKNRQLIVVGGLQDQIIPILALE